MRGFPKMVGFSNNHGFFLLKMIILGWRPQKATTDTNATTGWLAFPQNISLKTQKSPKTKMINRIPKMEAKHRGENPPFKETPIHILFAPIVPWRLLPVGHDLCWSCFLPAADGESNIQCGSQTGLEKKATDNNQGSLNGTHFGGIKQCKYMENLRDFPLIVPCLGRYNDAWQNQTQGRGGCKY